MTLATFATLLLPLLATAPAAPSDAVEVVVGHVATGPAIDGSLKDPLWKSAPWRDGMHDHTDPGRRAAHATRFALLTDGVRLFVGAEMSETDPDRLVARIRERDGNVYRDDCVQVFVRPPGPGPDYFCFSVNSTGTVRDTRQLDARWNADLRVGTQVGERTWSVELALLLADLELTPAAAEGSWGLNVTRVRRAGGKAELSTFAAIRGTFHQPDLFASLALPTEILAPYPWTMSVPSERSIRPANGQVFVHARLQVRNETGRFRFFNVHAETRATDSTVAGKPFRDGLDHGDQHFVNISAPTGGAQEGMLVVSLTDALDPDRVLARRQTAVPLAYSPIAVRLTAPWYKDAIFATQDIRAVEGVVRSDLTAKALAPLSLTAAILKGEEVVSGPVRIAPVTADTAFAIPITDLTVGRYTVHTTLVDANGRAVHEASKALRRLPARKGEVRFDRAMACLIDGRPFIPFGWFGVRTEALPAFAAAGYNTVGAYLPTCTALTDDEVRHYLDTAHSLDLKVICRPQPTPAMLKTARNLMTEEEAQAMRQLVRKWRSHPAVLAWYMCDEPEGKPEPLERRLEEYRLVDEEDPYHPAIVLNNTEPGIRTYQSAGDLLMPDVYPGFLRGGGASRMARPIGAMLACREATAGTKPVWITPQGHVQMVDGHRAPTFRELRSQVWQGVAGDATGFFWYRDSFVENLPASELGVPVLHDEVRALARAVRAKSQPAMVSTDVGADRLAVAAKVADGHLTVIAASLVFEPQKVRFEVDVPGDRELLAVSEGRRIQPRGGTFTDRFEPHEAHVYSTDLFLAGLPRIADIETRIEAERRKRWKPDNLAHELAGAEAVPRHHGGQAPFLNDGVTTGVFWPREWGKPSHPLPDWVDIHLPTAQEVGRVVVYSTFLTGGEPTFQAGHVQVGEDDAWRTVAALEGNDADPATLSFAPSRTDRVRLVITGAPGGRVRLQEIEIYAR